MRFNTHKFIRGTVHCLSLLLMLELASLRNSVGNILEVCFCVCACVQAYVPMLLSSWAFVFVKRETTSLPGLFPISSKAYLWE